MGMKLILLGAPGAGKGTQAEILSQRLGIPTISTGNMLRAAIQAGTPTGLEAKRYMDAGRLVPDEVIIGIVAQSLEQTELAKDYILCCMHRSQAQAEALDRAGVTFDKVFSIEISDREIEERMGGRRVCSGCGAPYHVKARPPKREGVCDSCGGSPVPRGDDRPGAGRQRLEVYHTETEPLKGFYEGKGLLSPVANQDTIEGTAKVMMEALGI